MSTFAGRKQRLTRGSGLSDADQQRITALRNRFHHIIALLASAEHKMPTDQRDAIHTILTDIAELLSPSQRVASPSPPLPPSDPVTDTTRNSGVYLTNEGRRVYFSGNTFPHREALRAAGAHWDPQRKAWWTGKTTEAQAILDRLNAVTANRQPNNSRDESISENDKVIVGQARYEGKAYYVLAHGWSKTSGKRYAKLAYKDGSRVFWASHPEKVSMYASYQTPKSIRSLRAYADQAKSDEYRTDDYRIDKNGVHWVRVSGSRGWYWTEASKHDEFDEFDN